MILFMATGDIVHCQIVLYGLYVGMNECINIPVKSYIDLFWYAEHMFLPCTSKCFVMIIGKAT